MDDCEWNFTGSAGILPFSKIHNRVIFFGGSKGFKFELVGEKLIDLILKQLNFSIDVPANVSNGKEKILLKERKLYKNVSLT